MRTLPLRLADVDQIEDLMTTPSAPLMSDLAALDGDIAILGAGGKMGPTLARLAKRAAPHKRIIAVARFSERGVRSRLEVAGVECIETDLLDRSAVGRLPKVANVVFMAGRKFGSVDNMPLTWAMNALVPAYVAEAFAASRIVVFSTPVCIRMCRSMGPAQMRQCRQPRRPANTPIHVSRASGCSSTSRVSTKQPVDSFDCRMRSTCVTACCMT